MLATTGSWKVINVIREPKGWKLQGSRADRKSSAKPAPKVRDDKPLGLKSNKCWPLIQGKNSRRRRVRLRWIPC
jgi:hypothetical protein